MSATEQPKRSSSISPEHAGTILQGDLNNLIKKVASGKPLSAAERRHLQDIHGGEEAFGLAFAKNAHQLAEVLGVDRKTIARWKKIKGCPKARADGRYNVTEWRAFKAMQKSGIRDGETGNAREEQVRLQNEKLAVQVEILKREWVRVEDVEAQVGQIVVAAKRVLLGLPSALAPQVVGSSLEDAERLIRDGVNDALAQLHYDPTAGAVSAEDIDRGEP